MTALSTDQMLSFWERYLDENGRGTEIEAFIVRAMTVHIYGEYQNSIRDIVRQRAQMSGDEDLANFTTSMHKTQSIAITYLRKGILANFSKERLSDFDGRIDEMAVQHYGNIITHRNAAAHGGVITMTLAELKTSHAEGKRVLDALAGALERPR